MTAIDQRYYSGQARNYYGSGYYNPYYSGYGYGGYGNYYDQTRQAQSSLYEDSYDSDSRSASSV